MHIPILSNAFGQVKHWIEKAGAVLTWQTQNLQSSA
jgi:hypothetical protein